MYTINKTTAIATIGGDVKNSTATLARMVFATYEDACEGAREYAQATGATYVKPATDAPALKEGQSYVEVVPA